MGSPELALAVNAGSSSLKWALFTFDAHPEAVARESLDDPPRLAAPRLLEWLEARAGAGRLVAIGHRIVHGGPLYQQPERITPALRGALSDLVRFAPNHLPDELMLVDALGRAVPDVPQVACFDTAFHRDLPAVARRLPIPRRYDEQGVRRYGFHGLSYAFLLEELRRLGGPEADGKIVLAHLGNGSSLAAVRRGRSVDTTMGFTPMGGVVMSTRSGDLDPGVATSIARHDAMDAEGLERLLGREAGLAGISGTTGDMRTLLEREPYDEACALAIESYVYSVRKAIGALTAVLDGMDTLVFSGGIGERAAGLRARICGGLGHLGVRLDRARNRAARGVISSEGSQVRVWVIPTDEEQMIVRLAYGLLRPLRSAEPGAMPDGR